VCAVAYALLVEQLERRVQTAVLVAGTARAMGGEAEIPDWDKVRSDFDTDLLSEPEPMTAEEYDRFITLKALGLR
jgi:hypothetical protein